MQKCAGQFIAKASLGFILHNFCVEQRKKIMSEKFVLANDYFSHQLLFS